MAHTISNAVSEVQWASLIIAPLQQAYAPSQSSAERALPMANLESRRRKFIGESSLRVDSHPESSPDHVRTKDPRSSAWTRFFGKSTPPTRTKLTEPDATTSQDSGEDQFYGEIETRKVESYPKGSIVQLSAFLDSDDDLCMMRRFGTETLRLIQFKEIELDMLARKIDAIDQGDAGHPDTGHRLDSIEHYPGWPSELADDLKEFEEKIKIYYDLVLKFVEIRALQPPTTTQYNNVYKWIKTNRPISGEEGRTMLRKNDFVTARKCPPKNRNNVLEDYLEEWLVQDPRSKFFGWLQSWFQGKAEKEKTGNPLVHHLSPSSFARMVRVLLTIFVVVTMLLPVFIIFLIQPKREIMVSIVAVFATIVMVSISLVIEVSAQEVFLGMAAYSAVLVALLSVNKGDCGCPA